MISGDGMGSETQQSLDPPHAGSQAIIELTCMAHQQVRIYQSVQQA